MEALYKETMKREEDILNEGFNLNSVWECEIYEQMEKDREMQKFFELVSFQTNRLNIKFSSEQVRSKTQTTRSIIWRKNTGISINGSCD